MATTTRQQILEKTAELLELQGYHATGLNQIVKESEAPRGSLYYYFPDGKEELASEAILTMGRMVCKNVARRLAAHDSPVEAVYRLALDTAEHVVRTKGCGGAPLALTTLEAPATGERLREACRLSYQNLREPFAQKLIEGGAGPERAASLAMTIVAAFEGAIILCRAEQSAKPMQQVAEDLRLLLSCALSE